VPCHGSWNELGEETAVNDDPSLSEITPLSEGKQPTRSFSAISGIYSAPFAFDLGNTLVVDHSHPPARANFAAGRERRRPWRGEGPSRRALCSLDSTAPLSEYHPSSQSGITVFHVASVVSLYCTTGRNCTEEPIRGVFVLGWFCCLYLHCFGHVEIWGKNLMPQLCVTVHKICLLPTSFLDSILVGCTKKRERG
jgi:hypothetical protein